MKNEIRYVDGDATNPVGDGTKVIVHCVNDIGKWGAGFVLALNKEHGLAKTAYHNWGKTNFPVDETGPRELGHVQFVSTKPDTFVANLVGQEGIYLNKNNDPPIRYAAISYGLERVREFVQKNNATVHMPRMGSGLAGGDWREIEQIVDIQLASKGVDVTVYDFTPDF